MKNTLDTNIVLNVDRVIGTNDYYINGLTLSNDSIDYISNGKNDHIKKFAIESDVNNEKTFFIYNYIGDYEKNNYSLIIDGEIIDV